MLISEAARLSGLSVGTIRHYEKSGMLPEIRRDPKGRRLFNKSDVEWLTLLFWLRETGMPTKRMHRFALLARSGDETLQERTKILSEHIKELERRREMLDRGYAMIAEVIADYDNDSSTEGS